MKVSYKIKKAMFNLVELNSKKQDCALPENVQIKNSNLHNR